VASVNKQSLREEFDALKGRFEQLVADGKMASESRALVEALLMLLQLLMAVFMEKHTVKSSANSSKPSSQTSKDESAISRSGRHGKGKALDQARSSNTRTVETVQISKVSFCEHCGEDLRKVPCRGHERRTQIDIVFEKVLVHVDAEVKHCPHCRTPTRAPFPTAFSGPLQYGAGIKAYVLNLLLAQMLSLKRVQQSIHTLIGRVISEATVLKYVLQLHRALERWEHSAIEQLLTLPAMHVDETSLRVEPMQAIGVIPRYGGIIIHDCWASYLAYEHCRHGLCGAHLLRELTFIVDAEGYAWARNMKRLLQETCTRVSSRKRKKLTGREYANLQKRYRNILTRGAKELPPIPPKQNGKRGRVAKSDAHNLWERLKEHESAVLRFAKDPNVAFTNNRAERDLRMSKVKQKVSGCFRKPEYAEAYCRISSYLQTMANHGYNPLVAIQMALSGELYAEKG